MTDTAEVQNSQPQEGAPEGSVSTRHGHVSNEEWEASAKTEPTEGGGVYTETQSTDRDPSDDFRDGGNDPLPSAPDAPAEGTIPTEAVATPSEPAPAPEPEKPKAERRQRGSLEAEVMKVTDAFVQNNLKLEEGEFLTPHRVGKAIKEANGLESPPSTGAVAAVFGRWQDYGFAVLNYKPLAFLDYTEDARRDGLTALKEAHSQKLREHRAAKREAAKQAAGQTTTEDAASPAQTPGEQAVAQSADAESNPPADTESV